MHNNNNFAAKTRRPLLILHHRNSSLPFSPQEIKSSGREIHTASFSAGALKEVIKKNYQKIILYVDVNINEALSFASEASLVRPDIEWVILADKKLPDSEIREAVDSFKFNSKVVEKETDLSKILAIFGDDFTNQQESKNDSCALLKNLLDEISSAFGQAVNSSTLACAVKAIGSGLVQILPHDVFGIIGIDEEIIFYAASKRPVAPKMAEMIEQEMLARCQGITGKSIEQQYLRREIDQLQILRDANIEAEKFFSFPIFADNEIIGVLTVANLAKSGEYQEPGISLLTAASDLVGMVFSAVRGIRRLTNRDPLTGAYNRRGIEEALERAWLVSRRYGSPIAVLVIDIDNFKNLNDSYGHSVGDDILIEFVDVFRSVSRESDIIARYGGDEFVAILPQSDEKAARSLAERLLTAVRNRIFCAEKQKLSITVSIGLSTSLAQIKPITSSDLIGQADRALFIAKREGRDRLCIWPDTIDIFENKTTNAPSDDAQKRQSDIKKTDCCKIIVVDDEDLVISVVSGILEKAGYKVDSFSNANDAIAAIKNSGRYDYGAIITDLNMPEKSGIELIQEISSINDLVIKIVLTGFATVDNALKSLREGAYDFIQKPVKAPQLLAVLNRALEYRRLRIDNERYKENLEELVRERSAQLAAALEEVRRSQEFTLEALAAMLDARENQTAKHSARVRSLAVAIGEKYGLNNDKLKKLSDAALLHDIGKISIPEAILLKPGNLLPEEWKVMRTHPEAGFKILKDGAFLKEVAEIVLSHHEWFDGSGYPRGLKGENICIGARILAVADTYETMRSKRVYRLPLPPEKAADNLAKGRGTQFDPEIADLALKYQADLERILAKS